MSPAGMNGIILGDTTSNVYFYEGIGAPFYSMLYNLVYCRVVTIIFKRKPLGEFNPGPMFFADAVSSNSCGLGNDCNLKISPSPGNGQYQYNRGLVRVNAQGSITFVYNSVAPGYWYQIGYS
jgi:hypothetical protein